MLSITDITPVTVSEYNKMSRKSSKRSREIRQLMLDLLAQAYESDEFIHGKYFTRANDILSLATNKCLTHEIKKRLEEEK